MSQDFKPIFEYLDEMKAELKADILELKKDMDLVKSTLDIVLKTVRGFEDQPP